MNRLPYLLLSLLLFSACAAVRPAPLPTADNLRLTDLMGTWHEVARLPLEFERHCAAASFQYAQVAPDHIRVSNLCWYRSLNGPMRRADAEVYLPDLSDPGRLLIHFGGPASSTYHVAYVNDAHTLALVGSPDRRHLWMLAREFTPPAEAVERLMDEAKARGFDISRLVFTRELRHDDHL